MDSKTPSRDIARWTTALEIDAVAAGTLDVLVQRAVPRHWTFKVLQGGEEVLQWHFRPKGTPRTPQESGRLPTQLSPQRHLN